jgi:hypothetical protein
MFENTIPIPVQVHGYVHIEDDLGNVYLDKSNAIHPANMGRVFARALANESNYWINRIAFGNGGTVVDAAYNITYKTPNDGLPPDAAGWKSCLYNETYSEYINESSILISSGVGAVPSSDPLAILNNMSGPGVVSVDQGLISQVVITCVLNPNEPLSQYPTDIVGNALNNVTEYTETPFTFDEIGLFTAGTTVIATPGTQSVNVSIKTATDPTGLLPDTTYIFDINVSGTIQHITIHTPLTGSGVGGQILYSDLIILLNVTIADATVSINDGTNMTYGYLKFTNDDVGVNANITLITPASPPDNWLFDGLNSFIGFLAPVNGTDGGVDNDLNNPTHEAQRMLTHLIFSPVLKAANRTFIIKYTLTISVARSEQ